jgi:hypothetical protein
VVFFYAITDPALFPLFSSLPMKGVSVHTQKAVLFYISFHAHCVSFMTVFLQQVQPTINQQNV